MRFMKTLFKNIKCVIFDLDGTLFDAPYNWEEIKRALGVPDGEVILSYLNKLGEEERKRRFALLERFEKLATESGLLKEGAKELLDFLHKKGIKTALVTNNSMFNTRRIIEKYALRFDFVLTRDSGLYKPGKEVIEFVLDKMRVSKDEALLIGDSDYDVKTAHLSGVPLVIVGDKKLNSELIRKGKFARVKNLPDVQGLIA